MPTIIVIDGLRVTIYPNDHRPAHVHIIGSDYEAVFKLNCPNGPPELRENYGTPHAVLAKVKVAITARLVQLCAAWSAIHGKP